MSMPLAMLLVEWENLCGSQSDGCYNIRYPSQMHLEYKSREISLAHRVIDILQIVLKFLTAVIFYTPRL